MPASVNRIGKTKKPMDKPDEPIHRPAKPIHVSPRPQLTGFMRRGTRSPDLGSNRRIWAAATASGHPPPDPNICSPERKGDGRSGH
jgi:hypothetical protein